MAFFIILTNLDIRVGRSTIRVLVLGGTGFIGKHIVALCLFRNYEVSVFSRGIQEHSFSSDVRLLIGDRDSDLDALTACDGRWDACIDLSGYTLSQVNKSASLLADRVDHYIYFSAVRAFEPSPDAPLTESSTKKANLTHDPDEINGETYGRLKVSCEAVVKQFFKSNSTIVRPQVVVGAGDLSGRLAYWLLRSRSTNLSLLPGDGSDHLQFIDVRDLSRFVVDTIANKVFGDFNIAGERITWAEFARLLAFTNGVWTEVPESIDFRELPLYRKNGTVDASYMNVCNEKAIAHGLAISPVSSTVAAFAEWLNSFGVENVLLPCVAEEQLSLKKELAVINEKADHYTAVTTC